LVQPFVLILGSEKYWYCALFSPSIDLEHLLRRPKIPTSRLRRPDRDLPTRLHRNSSGRQIQVSCAQVPACVRAWGCLVFCTGLLSILVIYWSSPEVYWDSFFVMTRFQTLNNLSLFLKL
jgi:hypothetical protein